MTVRRNIIASWLAHAVTLVVGLFLVKYVKETLHDDGYGAWIFVNSIAGYAGLLYAGFGMTICQYTAKHHAKGDIESLNKYASSIFVVYAVNSLITLLGAILFAWIAPSVSDWSGQSLLEVRIVIVIIGLALMSGMLGSVFGGVVIGVHRFDIIRFIHIGMTLLRLILVVGFLSYWPGLVAMGLSFLIVSIVENLAYLLLAKRYCPGLSIRFRHARLAALKECLPFTTWSALSLVAGYLIYMTDTVVIGCVLGTAAVTPYYIALRLCQMIRMPLENIAEAVLPKAGELHTLGHREALQRLVERTYGLAVLLIGGFFIGTWYFGDRLLMTWLGEGNHASYAILLLLVGAQLIAVPSMVLKKTLLGMGQARGPAFFDLVQAVANLVLSLLLIRQWGIIGVAWGTLIPIILVELFLLVPYSLKSLDLSLGRLLSRAILPQVPGMVALVAYCAVVTKLELGFSWFNLLAITLGGGSVLIGVRLLPCGVERVRTWLGGAPQPSAAP